MDNNTLENIYKERLEEQIVCCLKKRRNITFDEAVSLFYNSKLSEYIFKGIYGIQYLGAEALTDMLEKELYV